MFGKIFPLVLGVILLEDMKQPIDYIVNAETGEIKDEIYEGDRYKITRKKQLEYCLKNGEEIEKGKIYNFGQDKRFSMLSEYAAKQLADEKLTSSEYRILLAMISNTHYKSGLIAFRNNQPITKDWLANNLDLSPKTVDNAVQTLIDRGIIAQNVTNHRTKYFFNPYIQYRGRWINKTLYEMFRNTRWAKRD